MAVDGKLASLAPRVGEHFVAEVRAFDRVPAGRRSLGPLAKVAFKTGHPPTQSESWITPGASH